MLFLDNETTNIKKDDKLNQLEILGTLSGSMVHIIRRDKKEVDLSSVLVDSDDKKADANDTAKAV